MKTQRTTNGDTDRVRGTHVFIGQKRRNNDNGGRRRRTPISFSGIWVSPTVPGSPSLQNASPLQRAGPESTPPTRGSSPTPNSISSNSSLTQSLSALNRRTLSSHTCNSSDEGPRVSPPPLLSTIADVYSGRD